MTSKAEKLADLRCAIASIESRSCEVASDKERENGDDAFSRIVRLFSFRDRSTSEIRMRLTDEGFEGEEVEEAIERASRCGLLDDGRFADSRIRALVRKGRGVKAIEQDLKKHGIAVAEVAGWPGDYLGCEGSSEYDRAVELLRRKPSSSKDPFRGAYQKLVRNGYSSEVSYRAARIWADEQIHR